MTKWEHSGMTNLVEWCQLLTLITDTDTVSREVKRDAGKSGGLSDEV